MSEESPNYSIADDLEVRHTGFSIQEAVGLSPLGRWYQKDFGQRPKALSTVGAFSSLGCIKLESSSTVG